MRAALNGRRAGRGGTWPHGPCPGFGDRATVHICKVSLDPGGPSGRFQGPDGDRKWRRLWCGARGERESGPGQGHRRRLFRDGGGAREGEGRGLRSDRAACCRQTARSRRASPAGGDAGLDPGPEGTARRGDKGSCPPGAQQGAGSGPGALTAGPPRGRGAQGSRGGNGVMTRVWLPPPELPSPTWSGQVWGPGRGAGGPDLLPRPHPSSPTSAPPRHPRGHLCRRQRRFSPGWADSLPEGSAREPPAVRAKLAAPLSGGVKVVVEATVLQRAQEWAAGLALPP